MLNDHGHKDSLHRWLGTIRLRSKGFTSNFSEKSSQLNHTSSMVDAPLSCDAVMRSNGAWHQCNSCVV